MDPAMGTGRASIVLAALALVVAILPTATGAPAGLRPDTLYGGTPPHECDVRGPDPTGALGCHDWTARYETDEADHGLRIATSPDGDRVYVAGTTGGDERWSQTGEGLVMALAAHTGERLWVRTYGHADLPYTNFRDITVDPSGDRVYVTGWADDPPRINQPANRSGITLAFEADTGETAWTASEDGVKALGTELAYVPAYDMVVSLYWAKKLPAGHGMVLASYDGATGAEAWNSSYVDPDTKLVPCCLTVGPAGETAYAPGRIGGGMVTVAFDLETGQKRWTENTTGGNPWPSGVDATADWVVSGGTAGLWGQRVWGLDAAAGETMWTASNGNGGVIDVAAAPEAGLALAAGSNGVRPLTHYASLFAVHLENGSMAWEHKYDPGYGAGKYHDVDVAPGGDTAYVAGHAPTPSSHQDYLLTAVDIETGEDRWTTRWNHGPRSPDVVFWNDALVVGPDGDRVTMTGISLGLDGVPDVGVVSYEVPPPQLEPFEQEVEDPTGTACVNATGDAACDGFAASGTGNADADWAAASGTGNTTGFAAASATGDATSPSGAAASGTGNATGTAPLSPTGGCRAGADQVYRPCYDAAATDDAHGYYAAASGTGNATAPIPLSAVGGCRSAQDQAYRPCHDVTLNGDAHGYYAAASGTGDATADSFLGPAVAVTGTGNATAESVIGAAAASGTGDATADSSVSPTAAVSGTGDATADGDGFIGAFAASGAGDAAASGHGFIGAVAASGTGDAVASGGGPLSSAAVSGTGDASASGQGSPSPEACVATSGTGNATASCSFLVPVEVSGCEAGEWAGSDAACQDADPEALLP